MAARPELTHWPAQGVVALHGARSLGCTGSSQATLAVHRRMMPQGCVPPATLRRTSGALSHAPICDAPHLVEMLSDRSRRAWTPPAASPTAPVAGTSERGSPAPMSPPLREAPAKLKCSPTVGSTEASWRWRCHSSSRTLLLGALLICERLRRADSMFCRTEPLSTPPEPMAAAAAASVSDTV